MFGTLNIRDTVRPASAAEGKGTTGMLPTFVIGLREGVEAALIVGIIAAFLIQRGERKAIRSMWLGVAIAIALCIGVAVVLQRRSARTSPSSSGRSWRACWPSSPWPASPT